MPTVIADARRHRRNPWTLAVENKAIKGMQSMAALTKKKLNKNMTQPSNNHQRCFADSRAEREDFGCQNENIEILEIIKIEPKGCQGEASNLQKHLCGT